MQFALSRPALHVVYYYATFCSQSLTGAASSKAPLPTGDSSEKKNDLFGTSCRYQPNMSKRTCLI
jgi:hypothetical protein